MRLQQLQTSYLIENLDYDHIRLVRLWESTGLKLKEAALTADQIQSLFAEIEKGSTEAGGNRTLIGKGKDAAEAVNKAWEDLKTKVQNSGPIKNYDDAYDATVAKIEAGLGGPDNAINQVIQKYRKFAKEHPVAQSFIYAALIAAAGISGAGLGGAAVLGLLKMTDKLLQGEKFSSAAYSGAKTGAMAYAAGQIGKAAQGDAAQAPTDTQNIPGGGQITDPNAPDYNADYAELVKDKQDIIGAQSGTTSTVDPVAGAKNAATTTAQRGAASATDAGTQVAGDVVKGAGAEMFKGLSSDSMADATIKRIADSIAAGQLSTSDLQHLQATQGFVANALSNADPAREAALTAHYNLIDKMLRAANDIPVNSSITRTDKALSEGQVYMIFNRVCARNDQWLSEGKLIEGPMDWIKGKASQAVGAVAGKATQIGKNITTKVTADKLNSAWQKAGSPMDSEELRAFLGKQGVSPEVVDSVYKTLKIPAAPAAPAAGAVDIKQITQMVAKLPADRKARLIKYLTKQLGQKAVA